MDIHTQVRDMIARLARLDATGSWEGDLNPAQRAVLGYLVRANRFSRSPSHVAEYLGTTRGTVSQTCKSLVQKGYVAERRSARDKRVIRFELTGRGTEVTRGTSRLEAAIAALPAAEAEALRDGLRDVLTGLLARTENRSFGLCRNCRHHALRADGRYCRLLSVPLGASEADQICHEQESA